MKHIRLSLIGQPTEASEPQVDRCLVWWSENIERKDTGWKIQAYRSLYSHIKRFFSSNPVKFKRLFEINYPDIFGPILEQKAFTLGNDSPYCDWAFAFSYFLFYYYFVYDIVFRP